jgi:hypothetical protein
MIVTLKTVKYKAQQYTGPTQDPLPDNVVVASGANLLEARNTEREMAFLRNDIDRYECFYDVEYERCTDEIQLHNEGRADIEKKKELLADYEKIKQTLPPTQCYSKGKFCDTVPGKAFLIKNYMTVEVESGSWVVNCTPIEGRTPGMRQRSGIGSWVMSAEIFESMFDIGG